LKKKTLHTIAFSKQPVSCYIQNNNSVEVTENLTLTATVFLKGDGVFIGFHFKSGGGDAARRPYVAGVNI